ncbi:MAG: DUF4124 domain-containing protein [Xanthomonadaceae bacterium]|jgi:hypothetical protein|nr:DUF4124 domain-containing protein [Xanthomonadaceae bacterium]
MKLPGRLGCLLLIAGVCGSAVAASTVYRWTDSHGVTHASDRPPENQAYQTERMGSAYPMGADEAVIEAPALDPQCVTARENLRLLESDAEVHQMGEEEGKPGRSLSAEEREAQKALAGAAIKAYCPASAD